MFKVASIFPKILFLPHVSYQPLPILLFYFNRKNFIELSAHTLYFLTTYILFGSHHSASTVLFQWICSWQVSLDLHVAKPNDLGLVFIFPDSFQSIIPLASTPWHHALQVLSLPLWQLLWVSVAVSSSTDLLNIGPLWTLLFSPLLLFYSYPSAWVSSSMPLAFTTTDVLLTPTFIFLV